MQSASSHIAPYTIDIQSKFELTQLKALWLQLEKSANPPFFLTWDWIECWLQTYKPSVLLVTAKIGKKMIAAGLFTVSTQKRRGLIKSKQIRLHQIGDQSLDQIWMEYNDLLCIEGKHKEHAANACLKALEEYSDWDEIVISMMPAQRALQVIKTNHLASLDQYRPCYAVKLDSEKYEHTSYLDSLTANTRYQIRRSQKLYETNYGPLRLIPAGTVQEALEFFHEIAPLHIKRWNDSGYKNANFVTFHENLVKNTFQSGRSQLLKLVAGKSLVAIMYYHIVNERVYFYMHGLAYEQNRKLKPGLVAHAMATQHFIDSGMRLYDYMGGYSQYKEQLAELSEQLVTVVIQRPHTKFKIENIAKTLKSRYLNTPFRDKNDD